MAIISEHNASELRRILKEEVGRNVSSAEVDEVWSYLMRILELVWNIKNEAKLKKYLHHPSLFD